MVGTFSGKKSLKALSNKVFRFIQQTLFIAEIFSISNFKDLVSQKARLQGKPVADPFIIATAKIKDGCLITEEALKPNAPKIPTVCQHFSIDCTNVQGLMEREGWQF
ncbi:DUF4411 family protein [Microcystis aeruginosa]|uniref:DUF4411 family protein n=1 Tax=Microcystis aeruginosa TaxID=1126 RepID=UPI001F4F127A|nr:DUF4411 family protein [Microcystis aeruginosa]